MAAIPSTSVPVGAANTRALPEAPPCLASAPRVVVIDEGYGSYDIERAVLEPFGATIDARPCHGDAGQVCRAIAGADAVLVRESPIDARAIAAMQQCRVIVRYGVGVDNIDRAAAAQRSIYVANVPDYGFEEVSDHTLALMLAVIRRIPARDRATRAGAWNVSRAEPMHRIAGGTLGLFGYGLIGRAFHRKAAGLGFSCTLICDPQLTSAPDGAELVTADRLFRECDVLSLHAPLLPQTRHTVNRDTLALMKPTAVLVNTSRGGLIDEAALVEALSAGRIFGAGLDVFETEPPDTAAALFSLPNVVLTDHTAWYSEQAIGDLQRKAAEEIARVFRGEEPRHWVNRWSR